jgi:hypothetical protein
MIYYTSFGVLDLLFWLFFSTILLALCFSLTDTDESRRSPAPVPAQQIACCKDLNV